MPQCKPATPQCKLTMPRCKRPKIHITYYFTMSYLGFCRILPLFPLLPASRPPCLPVFRPPCLPVFRSPGLHFSFQPQRDFAALNFQLSVFPFPACRTPGASGCWPTRSWTRRSLRRRLTFWESNRSRCLRILHQLRSFSRRKVRHRPKRPRHSLRFIECLAIGSIK